VTERDQQGIVHTKTPTRLTHITRDGSVNDRVPGASADLPPSTN
jgi:hypothetical protein